MSIINNKISLDTNSEFLFLANLITFLRYILKLFYINHADNLIKYAINKLGVLIINI